MFASWGGNIRPALGSWKYPRAFRISWDGDQSIALRFIFSNTIQFGLDDVISPVGLLGSDVFNPDGPGNQVGQLQTSGIGNFGNHDQIKGQRAIVAFPRIAKPSKSEFELFVLLSSTTLYHHGCFRVRVVVPLEKGEDGIDTYLRGIIIDSLGRGMGGEEGRLINHHCHDGRGKLFHDDGEFSHEPFSQRLDLKEGKGVLWLPDLVFMQHHLIMAPVAHFELLKGWADLPHIICLFDDDESQHEHGMLRIDARETVIATLIHKDKIVTERNGGRAVHEVLQVLASAACVNVAANAKQSSPIIPREERGVLRGDFVIERRKCEVLAGVLSASCGA